MEGTLMNSLSRFFLVFFVAFLLRHYTSVCDVVSASITNRYQYPIFTLFYLYITLPRTLSSTPYLLLHLSLPR